MKYRPVFKTITSLSASFTHLICSLFATWFYVTHDISPYQHSDIIIEYYMKVEKQCFETNNLNIFLSVFSYNVWKF